MSDASSAYPGSGHRIRASRRKFQVKSDCTVSRMVNPELARYRRRLLRASLGLMSFAVLFYLVAAFFPIGPDWARNFYLSIDAGLLTSSLVVVVNGLLGPRPT